MGDDELKELLRQQAAQTSAMLALMQQQQAEIAALKAQVATRPTAEPEAVGTMLVDAIIDDHEAMTNPPLPTKSRLRTLKRTELPMGKAKRRLGSLTWADLNPGIGKLYRAARSAQKTNRGTNVGDEAIDRELCDLSSALTSLVTAGQAPYNPIAGFERKGSKRRKARPSREEWDVLLEHVAPIYRDIATVAHLTGMRPGEVEGLLKEELQYPPEQEINLSKRPGSKTGARHIVVVDEAWEIIARRARESRGAFVFVAPWDPTCTQRVGTYNVGRNIRNAGKRTGIKGRGNQRMVMYSARHGKATEMLRDGASPWLVAKHLGTSPEMIEKHYGHYEDDEKKTLRKQLEGRDISPIRKGPHAASSQLDPDGTDDPNR